MVESACGAGWDSGSARGRKRGGAFGLRLRVADGFNQHALVQCGERIGVRFAFPQRGASASFCDLGAEATVVTGSNGVAVSPFFMVNAQVWCFSAVISAESSATLLQAASNNVERSRSSWY